MGNNELVEFVRRRVREEDFRRWAVELLADLVNIDTSIRPDVRAMADAERQVFDRAASELRRFAGEVAAIEIVPIDPAIADDPYFSQLYYTRTDERPEGLNVAECYRGRGNLVAVFDGEGDGASPPGRPCVWNAHVDTVAPFYPATVGPDRVGGRGSLDDKAAVVMLLAQVRLLAECRERLGVRPAAARAYQFVIEEEMGGNGSLSVARDSRFAGWQVVVGEATGNVPYPANRGAVWFAVEMEGSSDPRINLVEMAAHVVMALEGEGRRIRAESVHPLFRPEHVQTCHGILGPHGRHPSAVNDLVPLTLTPAVKVAPAGRAALDRVLKIGLGEYVARYGDKSREMDEQGRVKVPVHYTLEGGRDGPLVLKVFGKAGHMGAIHTLDCAIIKAAFLAAAIMQLNEESGRPVWTIGLLDVPAGQRRLVLEGGQGFVPTHAMEDVQERLARAAERGARDYVEGLGTATPRDDARGASSRESQPRAFTRTTFEKLHNAAFACPADMPAMVAIGEALGALGLDCPPPAGWGVSCDARIFARTDQPVATFGPGDLRRAHGEDEFVRVDELLDAIAISTLSAIAISNGRLY